MFKRFPLLPMDNSSSASCCPLSCFKSMCSDFFFLYHSERGDNVNTKRSNSESHAKAETASQALYPHCTNRPSTDVRKGTMQPRREARSFKVQNISQLYPLEKLSLIKELVFTTCDPPLYCLVSESIPHSCTYGIRGNITNH